MVIAIESCVKIVDWISLHVKKITSVVICYQVVGVEDCHFVKIIPIINSVLF